MSGTLLPVLIILGAMNTIGEKIAKTRHERGLTQEALAEMANVNTRTI